MKRMLCGLAAAAVAAAAGSAAAQNYYESYESYQGPRSYQDHRSYDSRRSYESRVWTPDHLFVSGGAGAPHVTGYSHGYAGVGSPVAEVDARAYARTGSYATGYQGYPQPYGYAGYDYGYGYSAPTYTSHGYYRRDDYRYAGGYNRYGYDRDYDRRHDRYDRRYDERRPGYRDRYGYHDDRPPVYRDHRHGDRRCYCEDVYVWDR